MKSFTHITLTLAALAFTTVVGQAASAKDCYELALPLPKANVTSTETPILATGAKLCVVSKNLVDTGDGMTANGNFEVSIKNNGKKIVSYTFNKVGSEGATGTAYYSYYSVAADVAITPDVKPTIVLGVRNDLRGTKKGEYVGTYTHDGKELFYLLKD